MKIFYRIFDVRDFQLLQANQTKPMCRMNNLPINMSKCCVMSYVLRSKINFNYMLDGTNLQKTHSFIDLGVTFDP